MGGGGFERVRWSMRAVIAALLAIALGGAAAAIVPAPVGATPAPTGIDGCVIGGSASGTFPAWNAAVPIERHAAGPAGTVLLSARGRIWRYTAGSLSVVAGGGGTRPDTATGPILASQVRIDRSDGLDVDSSGVVYASDGRTLFRIANGSVTPMWTPPPGTSPGGLARPVILHDVHVSASGVFVSTSEEIFGSDRFQIFRVDPSGVATLLAGGQNISLRDVTASGAAPLDLELADSRFDVDDAGHLSVFQQAGQRVLTTGVDGLFRPSPAAGTFDGLRTFAVSAGGAITVAGAGGLLRLQGSSWVTVPGPGQNSIDLASDGSVVDLGLDGILRRTSTTGTVTPLAGADPTRPAFTNAGRTATNALFGRVTAVQSDGDDLLVAEEAMWIRADGAAIPTSRLVRIRADGQIVAVAGDGVPADAQSVIQPTGVATSTPIGQVSDIDVDAQGNVVFSSTAFGVGRVAADGTLTQMMRSGITGYWDETTAVEPMPDGSIMEGTREGKVWRISSPGQRSLPTAPPGSPPTTTWETPRAIRQIETDRTGALVLRTDADIRRFDVARWTLVTVPGTANAPMAGLTSESTLSNGMVVDRVGNVYVAGTQERTTAPTENWSDLWRIGPNDTVSQMVTSRDSAPTQDVGDPDDIGQAGPVTVDSSGRLIVIDAVAGAVRRLGGCTSPPAVGMHPITPSRLLDSRTGNGMTTTHRPAAGETVELQVAGRGGVPAGAAAATLNVTVTGPLAASYLTVWPCDTLPRVSNVNFGAGGTVPNQVTVSLSASGTVCLRSPAATHMIADVQAWYGDGGSGLVPLRPSRVLDTRTAGGSIPALTEVRLPLAGKGGLPAAGAAAAALNVTVTQPRAAGWLTVYPCGSPRPLASNLNFSAGQTIPNAVLAGLGEGGAVCLYASASTHVVVDVVGSWQADGSRLRFLKPERAVDTRSAWGQGAPTRLRAGQVTQITPGGALGVAPDARAVLVNATAVNAAAGGYVTFYPCDGPAPVASTLNVVPGVVSANAAIVSTSAAGKLCAVASTAVDLVLDVSAHNGS